MRFLLDAQLPPVLSKVLCGLGHDCRHITDWSDGEKWHDKYVSEQADREKRLLVTKDLDFYHRHMAFGSPRIRWLLTTGNGKKSVLCHLFRKHPEQLQQAFESSALVELLNPQLTRYE
ncbi:MAG: DUF5615 family PIN-like protein [Cyclobacteriaceae bacterium]|jgi:predicted nuclease of predicted toxin-antitoxin system|nr:DUF5615 family PIN-like protein [Cyclobacteriaceae bacterium]